MVLFTMFLAAINVFSRYFILVFVAMAFFLLTPNRKLRINKTVGVLLFFSVSLIIFNAHYREEMLNMIKPFIYCICYVMGMSLIQHEKYVSIDLRQDEKIVSSVIYVMAGGTLIHFLLNLVTNMGATSRNTVDIWTQEIMSATGQATLACLAIAVSISFLFTKVGKLKKTIAIAALVLIFVYNLILAGRTLFVISIIAAFASVLYLSFREKKKAPNVLIITTIIVCVLVVLYQIDIFGVRTLVESSNFYIRFYGDASVKELNEDSRMTHKLFYLKYMFQYPWGGGHIRSMYGHSAHDLYLDTYDESGVFALFAIVIYIISSLVRMVKCIRSKNISLEIRVLVLCTYLVCNLVFWLEPIMRGMPWLLMSYCFIDGAVTYLLMREKEIRINMSLYH